MGVVWIASYPKSGNTWVRFLLANYLAGPIERSRDAEWTVPDSHGAFDADALLAWQPVVYAKTHRRWGPGHPFAARTSSAIFVVRYPKDVMLSNLNYHRLLRGDESGFSDADYIKVFIGAGGDPMWLRAGFGTLDEHTASWMDAPAPLPRLLVRYEDLKTDAAGQLSRIVSFLGLEQDAERIARAAADSTFERMRQLETKEKLTAGSHTIFPGAKPREDWARYFVSEGRLGSTLADPYLDQRFNERFGPLMERLGYAAWVKGQEKGTSAA
jgi:hypothetical protein